MKINGIKRLRFLANCLALGIIVFVFPWSPASAESAKPAGTVLAISGALEGPSPVFLDMAAIRKLPAITFETFDPWDKKNRAYKGPRLADVLALAGIKASAKRVEVIASNDYRIPIRLTDLDRIGHILSYEMDGKPYAQYEGSENKGAIAVAIDFSGGDVEMEIYKHHLAWMVVDIVVE